MRYTDFDAEFPRRCLKLLGETPYAHNEFACTKLLAIGGTLFSATGDRQFATNARAHIAHGGSANRIESVKSFIAPPFMDALPKMRDELQSRYSGTPPAAWPWDPNSFELQNVTAGAPDLFRRIVDARQPVHQAKWDRQHEITVKVALGACRNALAHGNVWLLAQSDFDDAPPSGHPRDEAITGFALAQTTPDIDDWKKATAKTPYTVRGLLISPSDLRALWEAWANLLVRTQVTRAEGGSCLAEDGLC